MRVQKFSVLLAVVAFAMSAPASIMYWQLNVTSGSASFTYARLISVNTSSSTESEVSATDYSTATANLTISPTTTDVSSYSASAYSFYLELGNYVSGTWTKAATSETVSYDSLVSAGAIQASSMEGTPTTYTFSSISAVPEPGSFGMLLIGASCMLLRRRNRNT